jgi:anti-sigma factor RsiW
MSGDSAHNNLDERTRRRLASLADGSLHGHERAELEARLASSPRLRQALEGQRSAVAAIRGLDIPAPEGLKRRIEAERRQSRSRAHRGRPLAFGGALAAAAIVLALVLVTSGGGAPTVTEAAQLADLPATRASVPVDGTNRKLLAAAVDGVPFPNLHANFVWKQDGERSDRLDGRSARTVYYRRDEQRIGYTILAGDPIDLPAGVRTSVQNGVRLSTVTEGPQAIVTWQRGGRTCVLSGHGVSAKDLRQVASWKGDGAVPF